MYTEIYIKNFTRKVFWKISRIIRSRNVHVSQNYSPLILCRWKHTHEPKSGKKTPSESQESSFCSLLHLRWRSSLFMKSPKVFMRTQWTRASQVTLVVKNPPSNAGDLRDVGLIPGSGRSPGGGRGSPLQCSCLGNPMRRSAWQATVHRVAKSQTWLKRLSRRVVNKSSIKFSFF